jgi:hypothetical protein
VYFSGIVKITKVINVFTLILARCTSPEMSSSMKINSLLLLLLSYLILFHHSRHLSFLSTQSPPSATVSPSTSISSPSPPNSADISMPSSSSYTDTPPARIHPMCTRSMNHIFQQRQLTDGTICQLIPCSSGFNT